MSHFAQAVYVQIVATAVEAEALLVSSQLIFAQSSVSVLWGRLSDTAARATRRRRWLWPGSRLHLRCHHARSLCRKFRFRSAYGFRSISMLFRALQVGLFVGLGLASLLVKR